MRHDSNENSPSGCFHNTSSELNAISSEKNRTEKRKVQYTSGKSSSLFQLLIIWLGTGYISSIREKSLGTLLSDMHNEDWTTRVKAIRAFEILGKDASAEVVQALVGALRDPSEFVRAAAARTLGIIAQKSVKTALLLAIGDKHWQVRAAVVQALGNLGNQAPRETLIKSALEDRSSVVRTAAIGALGQSNDPLPLKSLLHILKNDDDWLVRLSVLKVLGKRPVYIPTEVFTHVLQDDNEEVRLEALKTLEKQPITLPTQVLTQVLQDDNEDIRVEALKIVEKGRTHIPLEQVIFSLKDPSDKVQTMASKLLGQILPQFVHQVSLAFLFQCLYDEDKDMRALAAWALGERGEQTAIIPLSLVFSDSHALVRSAAEWALIELGASPDLIKKLSLTQTKDIHQYGAIDLVHFHRETYVQSVRLLSSLLLYLEDKRGFVQQVDIHNEQTRVLLCFYEGEQSSLQTTVLHALEGALRSIPFVKYLDQVLTSNDEILRTIATQAVEMIHDKNWEELLLISLDLAHDTHTDIFQQHKVCPKRIIIGGINYKHVRNTDGPILEQILSACQKEPMHRGTEQKGMLYYNHGYRDSHEQQKPLSETQTMREDAIQRKSTRRFIEPLVTIISDPCQLGGVPQRVQLLYDVP